MQINKDKLEGIHYIVEYAIASGRLEVIKEIFSDEQIKELSRDEKESYSFCAAYFFFLDKGKDIAIKHLIFDCHVNKNNAIKGVIEIYKTKDDIDQRVLNMFQARDLNKQLQQDLENKEPFVNSKVPKI